MKTRRVVWGLALCALLANALAAQAGTIVASSNVDVLASPPGSVARGVLTSDTQFFAFYEGPTQMLGAPLDISQPGTYTVFDDETTLSPGLIPPGTPFNSTFIHADRPLGEGKGTTVTIHGTVKFDTRILGLIVLNTGVDHTLDDTDPTLGNPGTTYPTGDVTRGYDTDGDSLTLSIDRMTLTLDVTLGTEADQLRVLTEAAPAAAVPEPASFALLGLGFLGLAGAARRQRRRPAALVV